MNLFDFYQEKINTNTIRYFGWNEDGVNIDFKRAMEKLEQDENFRNTIIDVLENSPFDGFFWETPPVNSNNFERPFEFVLVGSRYLPQLQPEQQTFSKYYDLPTSFEGIVTFLNLGKDALLVVPCPLVEASAYPHLATFIHGAPKEQIHHLWRCIGHSMLNNVNEKNTWLSTAGLGVSWLHIRLDSRPKYYKYSPYKNA